MNKFYTYAFLREDRTPYYIGKGTGNRIYSKHRRIKPPKDKSRTIFLKKNLTEVEAFRHEIYMIAVFGRKDLSTGILRNKTNGGEGVSNRGTPEQRSVSAKKGHASKTQEQRSVEAIKRQASITIEQRSLAAKKGQEGKTPEQRSLAVKKGRVNMTLEQKSAAAKKGRANMTLEQKSAAAKKGHANMTLEKKMKGRKWWNDGCGNRKRMIECPGDGWKLGKKL